MMFCRTFIQCSAPTENIPAKHNGQERINSIALINIEREYANAVMEKDMERIINIFASRKGRNSSFF